MTRYYDPPRRHKIVKKKAKTLDVVLVVLAVFVFSFILSMVVIYTWKDWPMDTLITMVLGGSGIEVVATALITISKIKKEVRYNDNESSECDS